MGNPSAAEIADVGGNDAYRELLHLVSVLLLFVPVYRALCLLCRWIYRYVVECVA